MQKFRMCSRRTGVRDGVLERVPGRAISPEDEPKKLTEGEEGPKALEGADFSLLFPNATPNVEW